MAFWSLESEAAPLHLGALLHFGPGGAPDAESLVSLLAERAGRSARLRQRVHVPWNPLDPPRWVDDPRFAARQHIGVHPLEGPGALERVTAALMAAPLRRELPPWEIHLLTGGGLAQGFTLLLKVHHAAVDGLRAVELGVRLLDRLEADRQPAPEPPPSRHPGLAAGLAAGLDGFTRRTLRSARVAAEVATAVVGSRVAEGWRPVGTPLHTGATGTTGAVAGERVLALPSLATRDLQLIRRAHGGTLHDIVLAVVAGGLRRWFLDLGHDPALRSTRVLVPVSQRARTEDAEQGNQLSGFLVTLPLAEPDPLIRLYRVREAMSAHKARGPLRGPGAVATLPDLLPPGVQRFTGPLLRPSAPLLFDALVTDVPLPGLRFTLAGAPLTAMNPLPPLAQGHTLAIAASRYRDRVHLGIHGEADPDRDPRDLSAMLAAEVRTLLQLS